MGYTAYLQSLLQPLGVYDLREQTASGGELAALGEAMDALLLQATAALQESLPLTAEKEGLSLWEQLLPYPAAGSVAERRQRIVGLMTLGGQSLTARALAAAISACGVTCQVEEQPASPTAVVSFPHLYGYPEGFAEKRRVIEGILPCHLLVEYAIRWYTFRETAESALTWQDLQEKTFLQWSLGQL